MTEPTQEQIKEFWEWCGFKRLPAKLWNSPEVPLYKNESGEVRAIFPPIDLNNLFKYALPITYIKLFTLGMGVRESYRKIFEMWLDYFFDGYSMEDALFWACWQVKEVVRKTAQKAQPSPEITPERVKEEIKRIRLEMTHDLKEYEAKYPKATEKTLSRVMTE